MWLKTKIIAKDFYCLLYPSNQMDDLVAVKAVQAHLSPWGAEDAKVRV